MSALFPADESGKNKLRQYHLSHQALKFPAIPLKHLPDYVFCPDEIELEYPCGDKSKDTTDFSEWSYFKNQYPPKYREKRGRFANKLKRSTPSTRKDAEKVLTPDDAPTSFTAGSGAADFQLVKMVSRKSCHGWSPELLVKLRQPMKTDREYLAEASSRQHKTPHPRKTRAQVYMLLK